MVSILSVKSKIFFKFRKFLCRNFKHYMWWSFTMLIYVDDMAMAVKCNLFLYADDACLVFQTDNVKDIEKQLNQDFTNICD